MDGAEKAGLIGGLFHAERHEDRGHCRKDWGDSEKPAPFAWGYREGKNREPGENDGGDVADGDLA